MCQIIAARCCKRNIGAISGLYRGYLEHWFDLIPKNMQECLVWSKARSRTWVRRIVDWHVDVKREGQGGFKVWVFCCQWAWKYMCKCLLCVLGSVEGIASPSSMKEDRVCLSKWKKQTQSLESWSMCWDHSYMTLHKKVGHHCPRILFT